eukprot:TRINITY_DN25956_c0_g1_i1.p1 TRINITY_DN25956_c0_g1~~TRINITY_DN25956_c0_g1_i1.p1  ORF type:complete len:783 (-),score=163.70 TRINITY_DN25956_c0_g1_i1:171-2480(-)
MQSSTQCAPPDANMIDVELQDAVCAALSDDTNLCGLAASRSAHRRIKALAESSALPLLLRNAGAHLHRRALQTCASWRFEGGMLAAPNGWAAACAQVAAGLEYNDWDMALEFAGLQCAENAVSWELVLRAVAANASPYVIARCAGRLRVRPSAAQAASLALFAARLTEVDVESDGGPDTFDALLRLLRVLAARGRACAAEGPVEGLDTFLHAFFANTVGKANFPDAYDDALEVGEVALDGGGAFSDGTANEDSEGDADLLALVAELARCHPHAVAATRHALDRPLDSAEDLDALHVALGFAAQLMRACAPESARVLVPVVVARIPALPSPLLLADALRCLRHAAKAAAGTDRCGAGPGVSSADASMLLEAVLEAVGRMPSEPDVVAEGLAAIHVLAVVADGAYTLFGGYFKRIWSSAAVPLRFVTGFCRSLRAAAAASAGALASLTTHAVPLKEDLLRHLERWDLRCVSGPTQRTTERLCAALAGLAPLPDGFFDPVVIVLQAKLSSQYADSFLAAVTPLLAAMVLSPNGASASHLKQSYDGTEAVPPTAAAHLAEKVCVAVATLPPALEMQEHALNLSEALLLSPASSSSFTAAILALVRLAASLEPGGDEERRCYELLCKAPLTEDSAQIILERGLSHDDVRVRRLAAKAVVGSPLCCGGAAAIVVLQRIFEVALAGDDGEFQEQLADVFAAVCGSSSAPVPVQAHARSGSPTTAAVAAAHGMLERISDPTIRSLAADSFASLCQETVGDAKARFFKFIAEMKALTL